MPDYDEYYGIPNTNPMVLKNKLGIIDTDLLKEKSMPIVLKKLINLREDMPNALMNEGLLSKENFDENGNIIFDEKHLKNIHRYLFQDIYPFAGEYRKANIIARGRGVVPNSYMQLFMEYHLIPQELKMQLSLMNSSVKRKTFNTKEEYASWLAIYFESLIRIHPFPDGNGRAIKEFFTEFVEENQYNKNFNFDPVEIDWTKIDQKKSKNILYEQLQNPNFLKEEFCKALNFKEEKQIR